MGLRTWLLARRHRPKRDDARTEAFSWAPGRQPWLPGGTYVGTTGAYTSRVSRDDAISVPAVKRGRDLICSVGALPLVLLDKANQVTASGFLRQIDPNVANVVTLAQTLDDLLCESVAWWEITEYRADGFPAHARHLDVETVSLHPPEGTVLQTLPSGLYPNGRVWVMGRAVDARNIIRFDSPNDALLGPAGSRAVRRAIKLAQTSEMYADDPEAKAYWSPSDDMADPGTREEIEEHLRAYRRARRDGSEAYIPVALKRTIPTGQSAVDIQLAQLQQRSDLEIANIMGLDPEDIGVNTTSRTYANITDRRTDRINNVLAPYMRAITDRLSLDDVTRRGYRIRFDLDDYLKADPATRWGTYGTALDKAVMSVAEVREKEGLPDVPVERLPVVPRETSAPVSRETGAQNGAAVPNTATRQTVSLSAEPGDQVVLQFAADTTGFAASKDRRTIEGSILPFDVQTADARQLRFAPGSLEWNKAAVSRVKLDREHDVAQLLGAATEIRSGDTEVMAKFKIARTPAGDEALSLAEDGALDGLSALVEINSAIPDPKFEGGAYVTRARLVRVTLTADPAFPDARVTTVAASAVRQGDTAMTGTQTAPTEGADTPSATEGADTPSATEAFTSALAQFTTAVEALNRTVPAEQRATIPVGVSSVREPLVYSLNGLGHSFVRDAWNVKKGMPGSTEATEALTRLRKYGEQTADLAEQEAGRQAFANAGNTTDQADIIPPGYRPDLYVGQIPQGRPLFNSIGTRVALANATPFKVPYWVGSSGLSGTNTENTGPSTGTITDHDYHTVTPTAQSGEFLISRELIDSANPAIDVIAMNAMREEYAQDTEGIIATALAAATDDGSPVMGTSATSTEGCYVYAVTGTGNDLYVEGIRFMEGEFPGHRFLTPDRMLASPTGYGALLKAIDDVGRPMFPFTSPSNAGGTTGRAGGSMVVDGLQVPNAWSMTSTYNDVVAFVSTDMLVGESPLLTFRFEEKSGPESIILNIWGYFAYAILRPAGIHAINYTAS